MFTLHRELSYITHLHLKNDRLGVDLHINAPAKKGLFEPRFLIVIISPITLFTRTVFVAAIVIIILAPRILLQLLCCGTPGSPCRPARRLPAENRA
jgi:hypothetical protein